MGDSQNSVTSSSFLLSFGSSNQLVYLQNQLISIKLDESNYLIWKQQILTAIKGYGLDGFIIGEISSPSRTILNQQTQEPEINPDFLAWQRQDQPLASWILSSLIEVTGNDKTEIDNLITQLSQHFSLKDLGEVKHFLGIEVHQTTECLHLSQGKYIKDLLHKASISDAKGTPTPMISNSQLSKYLGDPVEDGTKYRSIVGALQYVTITRPEISFSVNKVSQFMSNPLTTHWKTVKRILRYLAGTTDYGIHIKKSAHLNLVGFSDSDWATDLDNRRSTTGYCVFFGQNLISWSAKKQASVSRSSTEAEYRSLAHSTSEIMWLRHLFHELHISVTRIPIVWVDNVSSIALASNPVFHGRTKHIELDFHFVRDKIAAHQLLVQYVPTTDQLADIFIKPLSTQFFTRLRNKLNVVSLASLELRGAVNRAMLLTHGFKSASIANGGKSKTDHHDTISS